MPVRNEEESVDATMNAIFSSTRLPDEIIIADGMSDDGTVARFMAYRGRGIDIRIVPNPAIYSGGGRNAGVRESSGDLVILADCGNPVAANWIEEMARPFEEQQEVDIVCGVFEPLVSGDFEHCLAAIQYSHNYLLADYSDEQRNALIPRVLLPGGGTIAMTRATFDAVGGYPEWLHRAQDKVFSRKAYALGMRVVVNWHARIVHHMRSTPAEVFRLTFEYGRGNGRSRFVNRHFFKLAGFYGSLLGLVAGAAITYWSLFIAIVALLAYTVHSGLRKVIRKDKGLKKLKYLWMTPAVLWPRDLGVLLGHVLGWLEWYIVPRYRRLFTKYMQGGDPARLPVLEP